MSLAQWILYDQCNISLIEPGVTDIFFILFTGNRISSPSGDLTFNIRSKIAEYAIAKGHLDACKMLGYRVHWIEAESYRDGICELVKRTGITDVIMMRSSEEYLAKKIEKYQLPGISFSVVHNRQFLIGAGEFATQFERPPIMEFFYRYMRKSRGILMETDGTPVGGKWNYDHDNRNFDKTHIPSWAWEPQDTEYLYEARRYYGVSELEFVFPVTRRDALRLLGYFVEHHLPDFGRLEDAMYTRDMRVHHSLLSTAINFGLLSPLEVIDAALGGDAPLSSREGFVRQILGWREYMRQFYLYYYDSLYTENTLDHQESLPESWWNYDGEKTESEITTMNCVDTVIRRVQSENYSHHIERLMIIGNYTLLMGYHPHSVNRWFSEMYTDAFEWVVSPNVLGMSQYSDGGRLATKPYISGGNYIDKMSDYCSGCQYSIREKTCPMTHLYWDFVDRNRAIFEKGRTPYILSNLTKIDIEKVRKAKETFIRKTR